MTLDIAHVPPDGTGRDATLVNLPLPLWPPLLLPMRKDQSRESDYHMQRRK
jgi:hypothetical protein